MRQVVWAQAALEDFAAAIAYIAQDNPHTAQKVALRVDETATRLTDFAAGRKGRVTGTYEIPIHKTPYILVYVLDGKSISIVRVIHERRDLPNETWPKT
jgi:addiction module RelE/StbE family toxin